MPKILMLVPDVPWPAISGGKRAHDANIKELMLLDGQLQLVVADVYSPDPEADSFLDRYPGATISIARSTSSTNPKSASRRVLHRLGLLFSFFPPTYELLRRSDGHKLTAEVLDSTKVELVWVDQLNTMLFLPDKLDIPVILSMQNVEADLLKDISTAAPRFSLRRMKRWLDWKKMQWIEKRLLKRPDLIVCLSSRDADILENRLGIRRPEIMLPLLFEPAHRWQPLAEKRLLFIGQDTHAPNHDAIRWLVRDLAPQLARIDPTISIDIVGSLGQEFTSAERSTALRFHGKVPAQDLDLLLSQCSAMIAPIVLGSGIKIKILEAASGGIPVIATRESLYGLEILPGCVVFDRANPEQSADLIAKTLEDFDFLASAATSNLEALRREFQRRGRRVNEMVESMLESRFGEGRS